MDHKFIIRCRGIILHEGKLLVVRHAPDGAFWALPGGHLESGEGIQDCLRRELVEELGVPPVIGALLYVNTFVNADGVQPVEFFFQVTNGAEYADPRHAAGSHGHEIAEMRWAGPQDGLAILPRGFAADFTAGKIPTPDIRYISG
jgi:8-oxo-dGTP pyrophosphatase MutT (NUDIX family)